MEEDRRANFPDANYTHHDPDEDQRTSINLILVSVLPFEIIVGVIANIWAFAVIIRRRLWLQHEGYVFLGAILITSALILILHYLCIWFWCVDESYAITRKTDFLCKVWNFFFNGYHCTGWLVLALLFDVCLRSRWAKKDGEVQTTNYRPSRCALIVALTLIAVTLLMNIRYLVSVELHQYYEGFLHTKEYYCGPADDWRSSFLAWSELAALFIHGLPIVLIFPVLFAMIACSGCRCIGCKFGADSREHFPRATLLSLAAIIYFLQFPATVLPLFGSPRLLFATFTYYKVLSEILCSTVVINGLIFAVVPILCIVTMPRLREATFKASCSSCGQSQTLDIEAITLRETGQGN